MSILYYNTSPDSGTANDQVLNGLKAGLPKHSVHAWPDCPDKASITMAIAWQPPIEFFDGLVNLKHILSIAAGVDHLLNHPSLPENVDIVRLADAGMAQPMAQYVLYGVLHAQRQMCALANAQRNRQWQHTLTPKPAAHFHAGILGAGELSLVAAKRLLNNGYKVSCWSRTAKQLDGITHYSAEKGLDDMLSQLNALVCLLPLTPETQGILNAKLLAKLPAGAFLINSGRGGHMIEADVLAALNTGQLSGALLDVFSEEPLPETNPIWSHPNIIVTPHVAAPTDEAGAVEQLVESVNKIERGDLPRGMVNRRIGY